MHVGHIDFNVIARSTSGASGADLANIINEAALRAVRVGRNAVEQPRSGESVETVIAGAQRKNAVLSPIRKGDCCIPRIGHALVAAMQSNSAPVTKITIVPRTSGALGYTCRWTRASVLMSRGGTAEQGDDAYHRRPFGRNLIFRFGSTGASMILSRRPN